MTPQTVTYQADGLTMKGQLFAAADGVARPGVLVFPEAFGLGPHAISRAERLAGMGYTALACDLHGEGEVIDRLEPAIALIKPLMADPSRIRARAEAAMRVLADRPECDAERIAAIGFCFGGTMALELGRGGAALAAIVGFHSGLDSAARAAPGTPIKGRVLVCIGADDPMIGSDSRLAFEQEMRESGTDWSMHLYGGTVHSFTNQRAAERNMPDAIRYSPSADQESWASMTALFEATLSAS